MYDQSLTRPRTTEHTVSARKHDIYISYDEQDRDIASRMHAILRRMGYITYSAVGQVKFKVTNNGSVDVRPFAVQVQSLFLLLPK